MKKILIFGNSGSGKSWLSRKISTKENLNEINLDSIFWELGGYSQKRSEEQVNQELEILKESDDWVVEGVFGELIEKLIPVATEIIFLDFPWDECEKSLIARGSEGSKQLDKKQAEVNFTDLLNWASRYNERDSKNSYYFHNNLFERFEREKHRLATREEVSLFLAAVL